MLRSLYAGVSGIRSHQIKMDVIGNNISNVNTQGFKGSRACFADLFNQTMRGATSPSPGLGGLNPMQVGLGVTTTSIDVIHTTGSTMTTGRVLDLAIQGDGFFSCTQGEDTFYTRAGNIYVDERGFLVTAGGQFLKGIMFINPADDFTTPASQGGTNPGDTWDYVIDPNVRADYIVDGGSSEDIGKVNWDGIDPVDLTGLVPDPTAAPENPIVLPLDFASVAIDKAGIISGIAPNGDLVTIGMIPLTSFMNAPGLSLIGDNLYVETKNSGVPVEWQPGQGGAVGDVRSGALEMSNVDLSREFTDMIVTQRGFQANSRIITVSDTMLEELINLKRN